jgi:hypothetical protein
MTAQKQNPALARRVRGIGDLGRSNTREDRHSALHFQQLYLTQRFGLPALVARALAELAFGRRAV